MFHIAVLGAVLALMSTPAYAYLDPGTGSIILQAIIGAIAIAGATVSIYWNRLKSFVSNLTQGDRKGPSKKK